MTTIVSCNEIMQIVLGEVDETYYKGTGHGNRVIFDNKTVHTYVITLDNFTKDAFNIREQYDVPKTSFYYWLSFNYLTLSTHCSKIGSDVIVFPSRILSPKWWPNALKSSPLQIGRSKYNYYCCKAFDVGDEFSHFEYFAIDNISKKGYYWKTISDFTPAKDMGRCNYDWDNYSTAPTANYKKYDKWDEIEYKGTGQGNKVILDTTILFLDNGSEYKTNITLDNYTNDAIDIRHRSEADAWSLHNWVSFHYITFATNCNEVNNSMVVFPLSISPRWWPDDLKESLFSIKREKYKFYRCRAALVRSNSVFEYLAIDNTTKTGYYWTTMTGYTDKDRIRQCYYAWEDYQ
ncbi:MAG: hypothetical protein HQK97_05260 [Nitrospirae bacterium]|nr:hypothetical protein [Nitrospirota bacterium]